MKFSISKSDFIDALAIVSKGRASRPTQPILSGIYMRATEKSLILHTTDLETNVKHEVPALVEELGETVVPGKLIFEIVKNLPESAVQCSQEGDVFNISCMNSEFSLTTMRPGDFPSFPDLECLDTVELPVADIIDMVSKVSKAISREKTHTVLTGIYLQIDGPSLTMTATDSYRLAMAEMDIENHEGQFFLVVPGTVLDDVCKLASKEETLQIGYNENQIRFEFGQSTLVTRKIEGNYPNYRQIIPSEKTVSVVADTKAMINAVRRVSIMAPEYMQIKLEVDADAQRVIISSAASDIGGAREVVDAQVEGDGIKIGFNYQYLYDGLISVSSDEMLFEANQPMKPGIIKNVGEDRFLYLSMPVNID